MWITTLAITYLLLAIDTYVYPGYTASKLFFDSRLILLIFVLALTTWRVKRGASPLILKVNWGMATLVLLTLTILTTIMEISHYPNYVFSLYHIHFDHTYYLFVLSLSVTLSQLSNDFYRRFGKLLIGITPFFIWGSGLIMRTWPMDFFLINVQEDQIVEQVQVVLYAVSTIVTLILAIREWSINRLLAVIYLFTFVGLFFVTGEEISWGQRILGVETPESIAINNTQGEITLHNHRDVITYIDRIYIALGLLGATSWMWVHIIARRIGRLGEAVMSIIPPWWLGYYYLLPALFIAHDQYVTRNHKDWREFFELILVIGILLTLINSSKYRSGSRVNA